MKLGSKQIKNRYVLLVLAAMGYYLWSLPPAEIRPILKASERVKEEYEAGIKQAMLNGKDEVYLKDIITSVKWDKVCAMGGYERPNELLKFYNFGYYPELEYFGANPEGEGIAILINTNKVVAVIKGMPGNSNQYFDICSTKTNARFILHDAISPIYDKNHQLLKQEMIKNFNVCTGLNATKCSITFIGDSL